MPFTPHRRHAITSLLSVVGPICLYQYLLAPNITVFLIRLVTQTRSSTPRIAHPSSSLLSLSAGVIASNLLAVFLHWLDDAVDMQKGLILDFVGLKTRPSLTQVLLIDAFLAFYQLFTLYVAYLADPLPYGSTDKLLEPPRKTSRRSSRRSKKTGLGRDDDQTGLGLGLDIGRAEEPEVVDLGRDEEEADLDDEDDYERQALLREESSPSDNRYPSSASSSSPPPLIFIIPHLHTLFATIFTYPSPDAPSLSFAGATPTLPSRTSGELDNAEQGRLPTRLPAAAAPVRIPGGMSDRGFW